MNLRRRTSSGPISDNASSHAPVDELDSDVLFRTGQASRLRRRGALRIDNPSSRDHNSDSENEYHRLPPQELDCYKSRGEGRPAGYHIRCGGSAKPLASDTSAPSRPYPLPIMPSSLKRKRSSLTFEPNHYHSDNGCGSVLAEKAFPSNQLGAWMTTHPRGVDKLDSIYMDNLPTAENPRWRLGRLSCDCQRLPFGCLTW